MGSNEDYIGFKAVGTFVVIGSPVAAFMDNVLAKPLAKASDTLFPTLIDQAAFMTFGSDHLYDTYFLWLIPMLLSCFVYMQSRRNIRRHVFRVCAAAPFIGAFVLVLLRLLVLYVLNGSSDYLWRYNAPYIGYAMIAGAASTFVCAVIVEDFFAKEPEPEEAP
jgi:hypothetical protein